MVKYVLAALLMSTAVTPPDVSASTLPQRIWVFTVPGQMRAAPAVGSDGTIYFTALRGKAFGEAYTNMLVQALNPTTGRTKWTYDTRIPNESSGVLTQPTVFNGRVYACAGSCIASSATSGRLLWQQPVGNQTTQPTIGPVSCVSTLSMNPDTGRTVNQKVLAFSSSTGSILWQSGILAVTA